MIVRSTARGRLAPAREGLVDWFDGVEVFGVCGEYIGDFAVDETVGDGDFDFGEVVEDVEFGEVETCRFWLDWGKEIGDGWVYMI